MVGSPAKNGPVMEQTSPPSTNLGDKDILGLMNTLEGISINDTREQ